MKITSNSGFDDPTATAKKIWWAGVNSVLPEKLINSSINDVLKDIISVLKCKLIIVGAGKAAAEMAKAFEAIISHQNYEGLVNVPEGVLIKANRIKLNASRPLGSNFPTEKGVVGSRRILELFKNAGQDDIGICLISGGGSALLPLPAEGISLSEKLDLTKKLSASGATINEMNAVRKHISAIKGGRLAEAFCGKKLFSLIISDVVGDPLDVIASGPTAADHTTFQDALEVLRKFQIKPAQSIDRHLQSGLLGEIPETPKKLSDKVENIILGSNAIALKAAEEKAIEFGYDVINLGSNIEGDTTILARQMKDRIRQISSSGQSKKQCILLGGETTVSLGSNPGKGGRNQEFVLALANVIATDHGLEAMKNITILSGGTDGEDGPTDAAGAVANLATLETGKALQLNPDDYLNRHDAYPYFEKTNSLFKTGLTGTNVMDLRIILVDKMTM